MHNTLEWNWECSHYWLFFYVDCDSQELLEGVERERNFRVERPSNATIFHHRSIGNFELQHVGDSTLKCLALLLCTLAFLIHKLNCCCPFIRSLFHPYLLQLLVGDSELEEHIIQHLATAAAMGRSHPMSRREGQQGRQSALGHPQSLVYSTNSYASSMSSTPPTPPHREDENESGITGINSNQHQALHIIGRQGDSLSSGNNVTASSRSELSNSRYISRLKYAEFSFYVS